jgi:hypothetical protein
MYIWFSQFWTIYPFVLVKLFIFRLNLVLFWKCYLKYTTLLARYSVHSDWRRLPPLFHGSALKNHRTIGASTLNNIRTTNSVRCFYLKHLHVKRYKVSRWVRCFSLPSTAWWHTDHWSRTGHCLTVTGDVTQISNHSVYQWWRHADAGSKAEMPFCRKWIERQTEVTSAHGGKHKNICRPSWSLGHDGTRRGTLPYWTNAALAFGAVWAGSPTQGSTRRFVHENGRTLPRPWDFFNRGQCNHPPTLFSFFTSYLQVLIQIQGSKITKLYKIMYSTVLVKVQTM